MHYMYTSNIIDSRGLRSSKTTQKTRFRFPVVYVTASLVLLWSSAFSSWFGNACLRLQSSGGLVFLMFAEVTFTTFFQLLRSMNIFTHNNGLFINNNVGMHEYTANQPFSSSISPIPFSFAELPLFYTRIVGRGSYVCSCGCRCNPRIQHQLGSVRLSRTGTIPLRMIVYFI